MEFMKGLFEDNFSVDDREASFVFEIPTVDGEFSLLVPKSRPWKQVIYLQILSTVIQIIFACVIYEGVVKRRGGIGSLIIGWCFVIPASIYLPFYLLDALDLRHKLLCLGSTVASSIIFFRCIEAMYGTSPEFVELSISNYCSYYSYFGPFVWNKKTKEVQKITGKELVRSFMERLFQFIALSLVLSVMIHYDFKPFEDTVDLTSFSITPDLLSFGNLCNSYLITILLYFSLNNMFEISAFGENLKGFVAKPIFDAPLTQSRTPTEFWTKRWNLMTHSLLKGGIFKPAKVCFQNTKVAMFLTFVVSGLYHDCEWAAIFYNQKYLYDENGVCMDEKSCYDFKFGRVTAFFAYTGIVMLLERPIRKLAIVQWLSSILPTIVVAQILVFIHLPVVKWYGGDWIAGKHHFYF